jgi:MFS family permease
MLLIALTFFTAGAVIAGFARNSTIMIVGRSVQGVGGGGISALTYVIVSDMVTLQERGKWFGFISMVWALGSVTGPVIGGVIAEKTSWVSYPTAPTLLCTDFQRYIFWLNLPFCALSFITIPIFLKMQPVKGSLKDKLVRMDWVGSVLFIGSVTAMLVPITWVGSGLFCLIV